VPLDRPPFDRQTRSVRAGKGPIRQCLCMSLSVSTLVVRAKLQVAFNLCSQAIKPANVQS
jgi:hypothetical protein